MKSSTKTVGGTPNTGLGQDFNSFLQGGLNSGTFGNNALAQTSGFGGAINQLLGGQIGDPSTLQGFLQGLQGNGGLGNLPNVSGNFNSPQFQGLDFGNLGQVSTQGPNLGVGQVQFNPAQFQNIGFQGGFGGAAGLDPNGPFSQALQQIANQQLNSQVADVRERYTGQSGTPAGFAEAALRAQLTPQLTTALGNANAQERGLNLQQLGMNQNQLNNLNQLRLQQSLAGNQQNLANTQLGLNAQGINTQNQLGLNSQMLQGFGLQQAGQGQNVQNQLAQMAQMLGQNQFQNIFNQGNAQFGANLGLQAGQANAQNQLQNQSLMNQFGLGQANIGLQNQQQQLQAILGALGPLFGGLNQATGLATPQAQTVQNPSLFSQIVGGVTNLAGAATPFFTGGMGNLFSGVNPGLVNGQTGMNPGQGIGFTPLNIPQYQMPLVR